MKTGQGGPALRLLWVPQANGEEAVLQACSLGNWPDILRELTWLT